MSTNTYYGIDPVFNDATDYIECDTCGSLFDYKEYKSFTCSACESGEYEGEGEVIMCGDHLVPVNECGCLL